MPGAAIDDRYLLVKEIGRGGMGVVYEVKRRELGLAFALKFLRNERFESSLDRSRFAREVAYASALRHENIVQLLDFGTCERGPYAVFELVSGSSLAELLDEHGPFETSRTISVMLQVARALVCAHAAGVIHRDLKASNVMLTAHADGRDLVKILDFGIAKMHGPTDTLTPTDGPTGTIGYMAPEVARGESRGDVLTDIYSLGVLFYELLSGRRPHSGDSPNALLHSVMTKPCTPLETYRPDLSAGLRDLVRRALSTSRDHRPQTAAAFVDDLSKIVANEEVVRNQQTADTVAARPDCVPPKDPSLLRSLGTLICGALLGASLSVLFANDGPPTSEGAGHPSIEPASPRSPQAEVCAQPTAQELTTREPSAPAAASPSAAGPRRSTARAVFPAHRTTLHPQGEVIEAQVDQVTGFDVRNPYQ